MKKKIKKQYQRIFCVNYFRLTFATETKTETIMASLTIGKRTSFVRLVELNKEYRSKLAQATDIFEKAEIAGMIEDISYFCIDRGGWNYLNAVKQNDPSLIQR